MRKTIKILLIIGIVISLAVGCSKKKKGDKYIYLPGGGGPTGTTLVSISGPIAFGDQSTFVYDPKLGGNPLAKIEFKATEFGSFPCTINIKSGAATTRNIISGVNINGNELISYSWDGKDSGGAYAPPGEYTVEVSVGTSTPALMTYSCYIVRLGFTRIATESANVTTSEFPLKYNRTSAVDGTDFIVSSGSSFNSDVIWEMVELDLTNGTPRSLPAPWAGSADYPENPSAANYNYPAAYLMGSIIQFRVEMGDAARLENGSIAGVGYPIPGLPIRITGDYVGSPLAGELADDISPGQNYAVETVTPLPATVGKRNEVVAFSFEYLDGGAWHPIPGTFTTSHLIYRTAGVPTGRALYQTEPDHDKCYIKVLDLTCTWADGKSSISDVFLDIWMGCWDFENPAWTYEHDMPGTRGFTLWYLLDEHRGRCGAWSIFLLTCMGYHGIVGVQVAIIPRNEHIQTMPDLTNTTGRTLLEVEPSADGQGNPANLYNTFIDHAIVYYSYRYYDPSYIHLASPAKDGFVTMHDYEEYAMQGYREGSGQVYTIPEYMYKILYPFDNGTVVLNDPGQTEVYEMHFADY
ncbi:MAG: flagellar hook assembly protein FlgD [Planctomycetota bacterium]